MTPAPQLTAAITLTPGTSFIRFRIVPFISHSQSCFLLPARKLGVVGGPASWGGVFKSPDPLPEPLSWGAGLQLSGLSAQLRSVYRKPGARTWVLAA